MNVDLELIQVSKIYEKNLIVLFNMRNIYFYDPGFFEDKIDLFLPVDSHMVSEETLSLATEQFVDLIVYKFMIKTKDFFITDSKLFFFTLYEFFETPFDFY